MHDGADHQLAALEAGSQDDYVYPILRPLHPQGAAWKISSNFAAACAPAFKTTSLFTPRDFALGQTDAQFLQQRHLRRGAQSLRLRIRRRGHGEKRRRQPPPVVSQTKRALMDTTPKAFIRSVRLRRAAQLLTESQMTITEITFAVGFQDVKHFRALFKEQFGMLPSEYLKSLPGAPPRDVSGSVNARNPRAQNCEATPITPLTKNRRLDLFGNLAKNCRRPLLSPLPE